MALGPAAAGCQARPCPYGAAEATGAAGARPRRSPDTGPLVGRDHSAGIPGYKGCGSGNSGRRDTQRRVHQEQQVSPAAVIPSTVWVGDGRKRVPDPVQAASLGISQAHITNTIRPGEQPDLMAPNERSMGSRRACKNTSRSARGWSVWRCSTSWTTTGGSGHSTRESTNGAGLRLRMAPRHTRWFASPAADTNCPTRPRARPGFPQNAD